MTPAPALQPRLPIPPRTRELIAAGALVAINTSGGKDSQAMTILLARHVPLDQLVAVHAPLAEVEWPDTIRHIHQTLPTGIPLVMAPTASGETLLERIERRGRFPDKRRRYCTSDFKRGPIERELRRYLVANPRFARRIINAMGHRRDESPDRAKRTPWTFNSRNSKAGRTWHDWLPIFGLTETDVFAVIASAGQQPHPVYSAGLTRCSCSFCIFGSAADLTRAAQLRPGPLCTLRRPGAAHRTHPFAIAKVPARHHRNRTTARRSFPSRLLDPPDARPCTPAVSGNPCTFRLLIHKEAG